MEIIALAYKIKAKSDFDKSVLYAFLNPAWAGNHVVEIELSITRNDLLDLPFAFIGIIMTIFLTWNKKVRELIIDKMK